MGFTGLFSVLSLVLFSLSEGHVIRAPNGTCHAGFVQCKNGDCEPYEGMCAEYVTAFETVKPGASTTKATATVTDIVTMTTPVINPGHTAATTTSLGSMVTDASTAVFTEQYTTTHSMSTGSDGCKSGFVACPNGACEPFAELCDNSGGTVEHVLGTTSDTIGQTGATTTVSPAFTITTTMRSTHDLVTIKPQTMTTTERHTVKTTTSINTAAPGGTCHAGFVQCANGMCEPYEALCEEYVTGFETVKSVASSTAAATTSTVAMATTTPILGNTAATTTAGVSGNTGDMTTVVATQPYTSTHAVQTGPGGCKAGFVACPNGECVPFAEMCDDIGGTVTTTTPSVHENSSSMATGTQPAFTDAPTIGNQTSPPTLIITNTAVTTTLSGPVSTTTATTTQQPTAGPEGCHEGFEQCPDGTCEPFHFMCTEHHMAVIG